MARWFRSRLRVFGAGAVALLGGSLLIIPAVSQAGEEPAPARPGAAQAPASAADRVEVIPGRKGRADFRFRPASGDRRAPYAFVSTNGTVRARQLGGGNHPTVQAKTGAPERSAQVAAAAGKHRTTLTVVSQNWSAYGKFITLFNRDTWSWLPVPEQPNSLSATVDLPPGNYYVAVIYGIYNVDSYLLTRSFTVTDKAQTVRLEEKGAKQTAIKVDDTTARSDASSVAMMLPNGDFVGFAGGYKVRTYVTTASLPGTTLRLHEILTRSGSTALKPSPYRYDLAKSWPHPLPASPVITVKTASLAKTTLTVRGQGITTDGWYSTVPMTGSDGAFLATATRLPATITEYVTPDVTRARLIRYGDDQTLQLSDRSLPAGTSPGETVGGAPLSPTRRPWNDDSRRDRDRLQITENMGLGDAAGNLGSDHGATTAMTLSSGGEVLQTSESASLVATVPSSEQTYQLTHSMSRKAASSQLSTKIRSEWTFASAWNPFSALLPLMDLAMSASGLDQRNRAGAAPVRLTVVPSTRQTSAPSTVDRVEWSLDDGATWTELPLTTSGAGVEVVLEVPATAAFAALRVTASNDRGGSLRRTVQRALAGPAAPGDEAVGGTTISNLKVNGGRVLLPGTESPIEIVSTFTASDPSGIARAGLYLWHGTYNAPDGLQLADTQCLPVTATTASCTATAYVWDVRHSLASNSLAGAWRAEVWASAKDGTGFVNRRSAGSLTMRRTTKLTTNAAPEPVKKGKTVTVTGALTRIDWTTWTTRAFPAQQVTLQWKKVKTTKWTTVKKVKTDASGKLRTTVKAGTDGSYRFVFAGDPASHPATSAADYVDVK